MAELSICYQFIFNVAVKKRNGRTFNKSSIIGLGITYENAVYNIYLKLKKRHSEILNVNSVRATPIAFAFENGKSVSVSLTEYPPNIPEDLNKALSYLPQKNT